jgi:hypothetical protein
MLETGDKPIFTTPETMPMLVLTVYESIGPIDAGACYIRLYRPVSNATVLTVLATPLKHVSVIDHFCVSESEQKQLSTSDEPHPPYWIYLPILLNLKGRCGNSKRRPLIRPIDAIRRVYLQRGAFMHCNPPAHLTGMTTDVMLYATEVKMQHNTQRNSSAMLVTTLELLKLSSMQSRPERYSRADDEGIAISKLGGSGMKCLYEKEWVKWHLRLVFYSREIDGFLAKVSFTAHTDRRICST